jgi:multiple sugar transport system substrate-binding protein
MEGDSMMKRFFYEILTGWIIIFGVAACASPEVLTPEPTQTVKTPLTATVTPVETSVETSTPTLEVVAEPTATATSRGVQPSDLDGIHIQFWHPWTGDKEFILLTMVNQFNASNPYGIVVTAFSHGGDLYRDIRAGIELGLLPNVAAGYNNQIQSWDNYGNLIVNLNDFVNDSEWGLSADDQADFYRIIWEQDVIDGKRLGLPVYRAAMVLFYNQTWAQELGFDSAPTTPAEFKAQACAAAAANNDGTGGWIAATDPSTTMSWILAFGGDGLNTAGDAYAFNTRPVDLAFDFVKSIFKSGCAWVPETRYPNDEFSARQGLFYTSSIAGLPYQTRSFEYADNNDEWHVIPYPALNGGPVLNLYGPAYVILESSPEEDLAAWAFIQWLSQPENQADFIAASGYFPTRMSAINYLSGYAHENPHWAASQDLLQYGRYEPRLGSWGLARWALSDAVVELIDPNFLSDDIPVLLKDLDTLIAETHLNTR